MTADPVAAARQWHDTALLQGTPTVPVAPGLVGRLLSELAITRVALADARRERDEARAERDQEWSAALRDWDVSQGLADRAGRIDPGVEP